VELARLLIEHGATRQPGETTGQHRCTGRPSGVAWGWRGSSSSTAPMWQPGQRRGDTPALGIQEGSCRGVVAPHRARRRRGSRANDEGTPLHLASWMGHVEVARLLIEQRRRRGSPANDGGTPLHMSSWRGGVGVAWLLIEYGADVAARANDGGTPLHWASWMGHVEVAGSSSSTAPTWQPGQRRGDTTALGVLQGSRGGSAALIEHGVDAAARANDGGTPLHWASRGHVDVVRLLIDHGADANSPGQGRGNTAHWACWWGHVEVTRLLIENGNRHGKPGPRTGDTIALGRPAGVMWMRCGSSSSTARGAALRPLTGCMLKSSRSAQASSSGCRAR